jgi:hypothetical protein
MAIGLVLFLAGPLFGQIDKRHQLPVFDFDGDRISDQVIIEDVDSNLSWLILQSSDTTWRKVNFGLSSLNDIAVPGDYDGDGLWDIAVWRPGTALDFYRGPAYFWILPSPKPNELVAPSVIVIPWGVFGDNPRVTQDFDGDGIADPAIVRRANGEMTWWILQSRDGVKAETFGFDTDLFVRGDYDGDRRADFAVYRMNEEKRVSSNAFIVRHSSDGNIVTTEFGMAGDVLVPGDYDGDGLTDHAVFRNNRSKKDPTAYWYWIRSSDGKVVVMPFGLNLGNVEIMDCPTPGDYNRDGSSEPAFWRMMLNGKDSSEFHMWLGKEGSKSFPFGMSYMEVPNYTLQAVDTKHMQ